MRRGLGWRRSWKKRCLTERRLMPPFLRSQPDLATSSSATATSEYVCAPTSRYATTTRTHARTCIIHGIVCSPARAARPRNAMESDVSQCGARQRTRQRERARERAYLGGDFVLGLTSEPGGLLFRVQLLGGSLGALCGWLGRIGLACCRGLGSRGARRRSSSVVGRSSRSCRSGVVGRSSRSCRSGVVTRRGGAAGFARSGVRSGLVA